MKAKLKKYMEWLSAEELHNDSRSWRSHLEFTRDEQQFLNDLIGSHVLDLVDSKVFKKASPLLTSLEKMEKDWTTLFKKVQLHENQLQIMIDDVDQLKMEEAYLTTHMELTNEVETYFKTYRSVKTKIFRLISSLIKKRKQKRLLN
ncbi:hypothetical protein L0P88_10830 [Muricauda sp. SCSIO 64092]|uniref:hypothetical protein n=1 Tax=Allomuricauda sp. SCSIO 64092 TaxID=2908842 RepID=UPI001FF5254C|nr:hypothetical protein [Muricauda sp. SCSIO 64092]UOY09006.1 hypothetical protein L0P88_10830 [Muricauda sp. SCSIO 64092]